ncbi:hypothetical protein NQ318_016829 [Aromia moschata]|uniref:BRCT domain-containing protein n=1 Tax=Aromia moschata TaxID=1265417 RepID=A0AAV8YW38_9CUCU|nr:hypothetical protein NQ318_016829 [Aromia moschata]
MKPKPSTGYFTPQASRRQRVSTPVHSEANDNKLSNMSDSFFHNLMSCPVRRELILNIISSEKENILKYKQKLAQEEKRKQCNGSPLSKVQKKYVCESPSALLRRRALEQQGRQSPQSELSDVSKSNSESATSKSASPIQFDKILDQVVAYVEIRSNDNKDRSHGAKALMQLMGAVIRDQFTRDVTHVVFKDGSFTTYEKAKLMKVHLVSVLWIEACRTTNSRVSENKFSAVGTASYDHNVSVLCSDDQTMVPVAYQMIMCIDVPQDS